MFQSTPPARAATRALHPYCQCAYVSIHAAREGGDICLACGARDKQSFNPRRPRGRRRCDNVGGSGGSVFQSTPPARAATSVWHAERETSRVSIHAAREGGDAATMLEAPVVACFNPRSEE